MTSKELRRHHDPQRAPAGSSMPSLTRTRNDTASRRCDDAVVVRCQVVIGLISTCPAVAISRSWYLPCPSPDTAVGVASSIDGVDAAVVDAERPPVQFIQLDPPSRARCPRSAISASMPAKPGVSASRTTGTAAGRTADRDCHIDEVLIDDLLVDLRVDGQEFLQRDAAGTAEKLVDPEQTRMLFERVAIVAAQHHDHGNLHLVEGDNHRGILLRLLAAAAMVRRRHVMRTRYLALAGDAPGVRAGPRARRSRTVEECQHVALVIRPSLPRTGSDTAGRGCPR